MHLSDAELKLVRSILEDSRLARQATVHLFGSRVHGRNLKEFSDIDLCFFCEPRISPSIVSEIERRFEECDLPYKVDVVVWDELTEEFRKAIRQEMRQIYPDVGLPTLSYKDAELAAQLRLTESLRSVANRFGVSRDEVQQAIANYQAGEQW